MQYFILNFITHRNTVLYKHNNNQHSKYTQYKIIFNFTNSALLNKKSLEFRQKMLVCVVGYKNGPVTGLKAEKQSATTVPFFVP